MSVLFNVRVLRVTGQVVAVGVLVAVVLYLRDNYLAHLRDRNVSLTWDFLDRPTQFGIPHTDFRPGQPVRDALLVGIRNTVLSAVVGIVVTTIVGVLVGVLRLSSSWLARKAATLYVEVLRNIPVLLIILFMVAWLQTLPRNTDALSLDGILVVSNRWISVLSPVAGDSLTTYLIVLAVAVAAAALVWRWRTAVSDRSGEPHHRVLWVAGLLTLVGIAGYFVLDSPVTLSHPEVSDANVVGGITMNIPYVAITGGIALYHGSHIAEIVRGSITAVPYGQTEAATALGLSSFARMRYVVLPQAFRIAVPPTINQYLSLAKNTSLGIAVAYSDAFALTFQLVGGSRAPALQAFVILMGIYMAFSVAISLLMNLVNRRLQLVER